MIPSLGLPKSKLISAISNFFDKNYIEQIARDTGFVQRESRLQGLDFFLICVFIHQKDPFISLSGLCGELILEDIIMSKQSLHERFNEQAVAFMKRIVSDALAKKLPDKKALEVLCFRRVIIGDSTVFQLPGSYSCRYRGNGGGASTSALKIQYQFNLLTHEIIAMLTQEGTDADKSYALPDLQRGDLRIEDLGYFKMARLEQIEQAKAFFVSRLRFGISVYIEKGQYYKEIDLIKIARSMRVNQTRSLDVFIGDEYLLPVRLIMEKLPKKISDEKRRKLKNDKHNKRKNISQGRLAFCDINVYITNASEYLLPIDKVRLCYSLRWQIEIIFKVWKSIFHLDEVKPMKIERFECLHYGKLLLIILSTNLYRYIRQHLYLNSNMEISELKSYKVIVTTLISQYVAMMKSSQKIKHIIEKLITVFEKTCFKELRKGRQTPLRILKRMSLT